jgi:type I restriction enzyme R subunit
MPQIDRTPQHIKIDEKNHVEIPLLKQLDALDWQVIHLEMHKQKPAQSFRDSFDEVVLLPKLEEALQKINPWMADDQIDEVIKRITEFSGRDLLENNEQVLKLLLENPSVAENRKTKEKSPTIHYIDFTKPENNSFIAISQFKVRIPGTDQHIIPDVTLFLNGLPVAVIECKSPKVNEPIAEAIDQLLRYSEQRGNSGEGNPKLFYYNQLLIATCRQEAVVSTVTARTEKHFNCWSDPFPHTLNDLEHGSSTPNEQQRLVAGLLDKSNLLSIIRSFVLFSTNDKGQKIKVVARYQQFRAVKKAIEKLRNGKNKLERSGIIWHTQGSGKSLTMMFMVREMYTHGELTQWKIVYITDRTQLEQQLSDTSKSIGFTVKVADSTNNLKELLSTTSSDLVMAMIHKFQERDLDETFPELNLNPHILIMTDEAHRSQFKKLGANLDRALPNASRIGYTGTPTDKTEKFFGDYIDKYTMREAIEDKVTLEIVYEGRTNNAEIKDKKKMDQEFEDVFSEYNLIERLQILGFGSKDAYLDAEPTIQAKAKDMLKHYLRHVFPNGFKAQVVANSREAAARYKQALDLALKEEMDELEKNNPMLLNLDRLKKLKTAVVISGAHNDPPYIKEHTDSNLHKKVIDNFKRSFDSISPTDQNVTGDIGFIIVNNMLLTGFDAPIEQVMYLDQVIKAHNLLQAISRVNRVADDNKTAGFVVDYVGVGHHLRDALADYYEKEQKEILDTLKPNDECINDLVAAHKAMKDFLEKHKITDPTDYDAFFDLFYDEDTRFEFMLAYRKFSVALDEVYPQKEALDYIKDFNLFSEIYVMASKHLRDQRLSMKGIPEKLRKIADHHLISRGIDQQVKPISILDENFLQQVNSRKLEKTKAAEIEHALRHFINVNLFEDPELYASFTETIEEILKEFQDNWKEIANKLEQLRKRIINAKNEPTYGLHRRKQMPFFRIFKKEVFGEQELTDENIGNLIGLTQSVFTLLEAELSLKGFWDNKPARNRLKASLQEILLSPEFSTKIPSVIPKRAEIISRIMELAENNNDTILYSA